MLAFYGFLPLPDRHCVTSSSLLPRMGNLTQLHRRQPVPQPVPQPVLPPLSAVIICESGLCQKSRTAPQIQDNLVVSRVAYTRRNEGPLPLLLSLFFPPSSSSLYLVFFLSACFSSHVISCMSTVGLSTLPMATPSSTFLLSSPV